MNDELPSYVFTKQRLHEFCIQEGCSADGMYYLNDEIHIVKPGDLKYIKA